MIRIASWAASAAVLAAMIIFTAPAAIASCAEEPTPSPDAFVGTVINTRNHDRVATVVTDAGEQVTVRGAAGSTFLNTGPSSVDRQYITGARYEFHPRNNRTPYSDDACTATNQLAGPSSAPVEPGDGTAVPAQLAALIAVAALGAVIVIRWRRQRRSAVPPSPDDRS